MSTLFRNVAFIIIDCRGGSELIVDSEEVLVRHFGMSERIIGSRDVAVGASLPELVASRVAASKKETNIAI